MPPNYPKLPKGETVAKKAGKARASDNKGKKASKMSQQQLQYRKPALFLFGKDIPHGAEAVEEGSVENTARLVVQNTTIELGTQIARIPITIESDHPGQMISGIYMTAAASVPEDKEVALIDLETAYDESLWNVHPKPIQQIFALGHNVAAFNQITWFEPEDKLAIPCDGVVAILTIDTSKVLVPGEKRIITDFAGYTSATVLKENWTYWPIRLEHKAAILTIAPKHG